MCRGIRSTPAASGRSPNFATTPFSAALALFTPFSAALALSSNLAAPFAASAFITTLATAYFSTPAIDPTSVPASLSARQGTPPTLATAALATATAALALASTSTLATAYTLATAAVALATAASALASAALALATAALGPSTPVHRPCGVPDVFQHRLHNTLVQPALFWRHVRTRLVGELWDLRRLGEFGRRARWLGLLRLRGWLRKWQGLHEPKSFELRLERHPR